MCIFLMSNILRVYIIEIKKIKITAQVYLFTKIVHLAEHNSELKLQQKEEFFTHN